MAEVANFLQIATHYMCDHGQVIEDGDTMDGPGGVRWQAYSFEESIFPTPRDTLRWRPLDGSAAPAHFGLP